MEFKTIIGITAGILTSASLIPQIIKILKDKKAESLSAGMLFVLLSGNSLWCWYGILLNDLPIMITNAFSVLCDLTSICLNYKYSRRK